MIIQYPPQSEWFLALKMRDDTLKSLWEKGQRSGLARRITDGYVSKILGIKYAIGMWWIELNDGAIAYDNFMAEWERGDPNDDQLE